jgi:hypothetical protein
LKNNLTPQDEEQKAEEKTLLDLHRSLIDQYDRIMNRNLKGEALKEEVFRSRAAVEFAEQAIKSGALITALYKLSIDSVSGMKPAQLLLGEK